MNIIIAVWNVKTIIRIGDDKFCVPAVAVVTGKLRVITQVFVFLDAIATMTASTTEPGYANPTTFGEVRCRSTLFNNFADNFMSQNKRRMMRWKFTIQNMQVSTTNTTRLNAQE